jgi:glycosyltransferase involved in cell wall biosynthesis
VTRPLVSVAMCTHQGERYLEEQLESVAWQTRPPDELVICDDASTDGTVEIVERFQSRAPFPVRLSINNDRLGYRRNFEKAISLCEGDFIFLADQDDIWKPEKLSMHTTILLESPEVGAVFSDGDVVNERLAPCGYRLWEIHGFDAAAQRQFSRGGAFALLLAHNVVTGMTMGFRTSFRNLVLPIPAQWVHDYWIAFLLAAVTDLAMIPRPLVKYRQHDAQVVGVANQEWPPVAKRFRDVAAQKLKRRYAPGFLRQADRCADVYERLKARVADYPDVSKAIDRVGARIRHLRARADIWDGKPRLPLLVREALSLGYHRYSKGWRSIAADAFLS